MTPLRQKMIRELELHRKSPLTIDAYVKAVARLAQHYDRSPDAISVEEVRDFLHHLITQEKVAFSTWDRKRCQEPFCSFAARVEAEDPKKRFLTPFPTPAEVY